MTCPNYGMIHATNTPVVNRRIVRDNGFDDFDRIALVFFFSVVALLVVVGDQASECRLTVLVQNPLLDFSI